MRKVKNKVFSIILLISIIFLAILWNNEQKYRARLKRVEQAFIDLKTRIYLLELKSRTLKLEIEMVKISNYQATLKGLSRKDKPAKGPAKKKSARRKMKKLTQKSL